MVCWDTEFSLPYLFSTKSFWWDYWSMYSKFVPLAKKVLSMNESNIKNVCYLTNIFQILSTRLDENNSETAYWKCVNTLRKKLTAQHVTLFDKIAFMSGKWRVKSRPLASAISISNLAGQIVKSTIIVEHCFQKVSTNEKTTFDPVKIPLAFGMNTELRSMIQEVNPCAISKRTVSCVGWGHKSCKKCWHGSSWRQYECILYHGHSWLLWNLSIKHTNHHPPTLSWQLLIMLELMSHLRFDSSYCLTTFRSSVHAL